MKVERITAKEQLRRLIVENGRLDERMWWVEADASDLADALEALRGHAVYLGPSTSDFDDPEEAREAQALHNCLIEAARKALDKHREQAR